MSSSREKFREGQRCRLEGKGVRSLDYVPRTGLEALALETMLSVPHFPNAGTKLRGAVGLAQAPTRLAQQHRGGGLGDPRGGARQWGWGRAGASGGAPRPPGRVGREGEGAVITSQRSFGLHSQRWNKGSGMRTQGDVVSLTLDTLSARKEGRAPVTSGRSGAQAGRRRGLLCLENSKQALSADRLPGAPVRWPCGQVSPYLTEEQVEAQKVSRLLKVTQPTGTALRSEATAPNHG